VTNNLDSGTGSLRAEIAAALSGDTINFDPSLDGQTITLTSGELAINTSLSINGPGAAQLTISGGGTDGIFASAASTTVALSGLTLSNGHGGAGGAILNQGTMTVSNSTLSGNTCSQGGAILNKGKLTISNSTLSGNTAPDGGCGGAIISGGSLTITDSTLSGNTAKPHIDGTFVNPGYGGAIYNIAGGRLTLSNCTLSDNSAPQGDGSAIYMGYKSGKVTVTGCTLTDSAGGYGVFIWVDGGSLTVKNTHFHNPDGWYIHGHHTDGGGNTFN
jgi:hypothetical protein